MNFVNLTPHTISVQIYCGNNAGEVISFFASGQIARVSQENVEKPSLDFGCDSFMLSQPVFGDIQGLPAPEDDTIYIVSALVASQCKNRGDVVSPDTGKTACRNDDGTICFVRGFLLPA